MIYVIIYNASNEYYLTDIIDILIKNNISVNYYKLDNNKNYEIKNIINTQYVLTEINDYIMEN
jgi:bifunctional N-acetylglucosamine-1-phosphate-uridyltransferase/glucosamine-1-phosphate-acetyltransferase GlmU-like protein